MKTLVFSGSGVLFPAHLGAAQRLYEDARSKGIQFPDRLVGTSGGSIVAAFLSTGAEPKDGLELVRKSMPKEQISMNWPPLLAILFKWGVFNLDKLEKALKGYVPGKFSEAKLPLHVVTTDVNTQKTIVFSTSNSPNTSVPAAVAASSSIPIMFSPRKIEPGLLVDGGVTDMIAVDLFPESVGIRLLSEGEGTPKPPKSFVDYLIAILGAMLSTMERQHIEEALFAKVVTIHLPWNGIDFWRFDEKVLQMLYDKGYQAVDEKLKSGWTWQ